jgi:hypothetical protein
MPPTKGRFGKRSEPRTQEAGSAMLHQTRKVTVDLTLSTR